jgi:3-hydroxyisobutyrate dehydrogenase-like beta-hydroxyacid dehydrogenase
MSRRTQKNVGVVGLGIIGQRVAANLRRRGFHVFVWNRTPRPFPNFVGSPAEIATLCDFVQIFVSDDEALLEMVQAMKQSLNAHHVIMAHSTVAPHTMRAAAEMVHRRGGQFLDAPFTGSKMAAEKGEMVYYVGGDDAAYRRAKPVLEASSKEIIEIGEIGQATTIKLATNMVTAATVQVAAEALALVHSAGLPLEKFAAAMRSNGSNSGTLTMKLPKMIEGDFEPHFSVKHMLKDVLIATRLARTYGLTFGATETARDSLLAEARNDRADHDYASMVHSFFPDGPPGTQPAEEDEVEEQGSFAGLEERPAEEPTREDEPEPRQENTLAADAEKAPEAKEETAEVPEIEPETKSQASDVDVAKAHEPGERATEIADEPTEEEKPVTQEAVEPEPVAASVSEEPRKESLVRAEVASEPRADAKIDPAADEKNGARRGFLSRMFGRGSDH